MKKISLSLLMLILLLNLLQAKLPLQKPPKLFTWQMLRANEININGWLKVQATEDLQEGLPGLLDLINSDVSNELFAHHINNISTTSGFPTWWHGEQEGYWHEGLIHLAFLVNDKAAIRKVTKWVDDILKNQSTNGYIGIYSPDIRLLPVSDPRYGENGGELHTQAHALLALIAFYEHTGRSDVLAAVERAAQLTMKTYAHGVFGTTGAKTSTAGGNSHSVTFADPLIQLYRLTGNENYLRFVAKMYDDYNIHSPRDKDLTIKNIEDKSYLFHGHGAHTAESFHMVQAAALTEGGKMKNLPQIAIEKLLYHLTPGGALVSAEMIAGNPGNGNRLYEHCTQIELMKSFNFITEYTGNLILPERLARLYFNAVQGAHLHPLTAVQYLSRDDRMDIVPVNKLKKGGHLSNEDTQFVMSSSIRPTCCPGSAGRALPYFVADTWMKSPDGKALAVMNFAPTSINTIVQGTKVNIVEDTEYPFNDNVTMTVCPDKPLTFDLFVRLPLEGEIKIISASGAKVSKKDGMLIFRKNWKSNDRIELKLDMPVVCEKTQDGEAEYYRRGSLVFALPFKCDVKPIKENPEIQSKKPSGLFEWDIRVPDKSKWSYRIDSKSKFKPVYLAGDKNHPWQNPTIGIAGTMIDQNGKSVPVTLLPEGSLISRRVTFFDESVSAEKAEKLPKGSTE